MRRRPRTALLWVGTVAAGLTAAPLVVSANAQAATTAPVYQVTQEGLTQSEAQRLVDTFGIANALQDNGSFEHVGAGFAAAPSRVVGAGLDESGRATVTDGLDLAALGGVTPIADTAALAEGDRFLRSAGLTAGIQARPVLSHTRLTVTDGSGRVLADRPVDTAVSYDLTLNGLPLTGQGARLRLTAGPDGAITQLSHGLRKLARGADVPILGVDEATRACAALFGSNVRQNPPILGYHSPKLTARAGSGSGTVRTIFPEYTCDAVDEVGPLRQRVPAVAGSGPSGTLSVSLSGGVVTASATAIGGTAPYTFSWASSTTALTEQQSQGSRTSYSRVARDTTTGAERVQLEVTDANGLSATGSVDLTGDGTGTGVTVPGGGGFETLTVGRVDAGIEAPVVGGKCGTASKLSADGFKKTLAAHGVPTQFDWRGNSAWERDFKDSAFGGIDHLYVDDVDIVWYSGHGNSNGFTFNTNQDDRWITPADARWGDRDLKWLQLESCHVLANPASWLPAFQGLHLLNGFVTGASCNATGLGDAFAKYLFPGFLRPALKVRQAWAAAAIAAEPKKVKYRTMGVLGAPVGGVYPWNFDDYFWGQGPTGPDIMPHNGMFWTLTGTV